MFTVEVVDTIAETVGPRREGGSMAAGSEFVGAEWHDHVTVPDAVGTQGRADLGDDRHGITEGKTNLPSRHDGIRQLGLGGD